jgi:hypothetical protein
LYRNSEHRLLIQSVVSPGTRESERSELELADQQHFVEE